MRELGEDRSGHLLGNPGSPAGRYASRIYKASNLMYQS
jgi:hypothetical protein